MTLLCLILSDDIRKKELSTIFGQEEIATPIKKLKKQVTSIIAGMSSAQKATDERKEASEESDSDDSDAGDSDDQVPPPAPPPAQPVGDSTPPRLFGSICGGFALFSSWMYN